MASKRYWIRPLGRKETAPGQTDTLISKGYKFALVDRGIVIQVHKNIATAQAALRKITSIYPPRKSRHPKPIEIVQPKEDDFYFSTR